MKKTRIDDDIQIFLSSSIEKDQTDTSDIQQLLDALCRKFHADAAFVIECLENETGFFYSYTSSQEQVSLSNGQIHTITHTDYEAVVNTYRKNALCEHNPFLFPGITTGSVLHYGILHGKIWDGTVGLKFFSEKEWTDEERDAVTKVGHVLRNFIINDRLIRINTLKARQTHNTLERALFLGLNTLFLDTYYVNFTTDECQFVIANCDEKFTNLPSGSYDLILKEYIDNVVHEADREMFAKLASRSYGREHLDSEHSHYSFTYRRSTRNGYKWLHVYLILSSLADDGKVENVIITFCDVNEQKQREIEYKARLEQTNRNLTASLEQESKYKQAIKDAYDASVKANEAKSFFISNMSHDIRTPMNGIIGMTAIAAAHIHEPEKITECLQKIDISSKYLLGLINDILDMSKIESGKVNLTEKDTYLPDFLHSVVTLLQLSAKERCHTFTVNMHDVYHKYLTCDTLRLHQIFVNIIGNAIKYTPNGGRITFEVTELASTSPKYANLKFVVTDNGIGMEPDFLPHLFDAFAQESTGARSELKGSGLGMAITHNLVTMLGGKIDVQSAKGKGSVFTIYLPLKITINKEKEAAAAPLPECPTVSDDAFLYGRRFLLAEDNELNIEIMTELLLDKHVTIEVARNGKEAVTLFTQSKPGDFDAILMDLQMPVMNGCEAAVCIRNSSHKDADKIPIIALSADAFSDSIQKALAAGMNAHIAKPISFPSLCRTLSSCIR